MDEIGPHHEVVLETAFSNKLPDARLKLSETPDCDPTHCAFGESLDNNRRNLGSRMGRLARGGRRGLELDGTGGGDLYLQWLQQSWGRRFSRRETPLE